LELVPDDDAQLKKKPVQSWDSAKHRFVTNQIGSDNKKRIRTENGTLVPASFQSDR
jgi:ATP-dependent RNA helicase DDX54/DBP10